MQTKTIKKAIYLNGRLDRIMQKYKRYFLNVSLIASKSNWYIHYAYYKPTKPSKEEIEAFEKKVKALKIQLENLKRKYKITNPNLLRILEDKLNHIVEEYKTYPFSDRRVFFNTRLNFIKSLIYKCFSKDA